jgi:hypothetical protein
VICGHIWLHGLIASFYNLYLRGVIVQLSTQRPTLTP